MTRPRSATLTLKCDTAGCECRRTVPVRLTETDEGGQVIEAHYEKTCAVCGHERFAHSTVEVERGDFIERRKRARRPTEA